MNKKGLWFATLSVIIIMIFFISFSLNVISTGKKAAINEIGRTSKSIIESYYKTERRNYFIDKSIKYSTLISLKELAAKGGINKNECFTENYALWNKGCEFDNLESGFLNKFKLIFSEYLENYDIKEEDFVVSLQDNKIHIDTKESLNLGVKSKVKKTMKGLAKISGKNEKVKKTKENLEKLNLIDYIYANSERYGVPKDIILGVIAQESGGNIYAPPNINRNKFGSVVSLDHGLMQINDKAHPGYFDGSKGCIAKGVDEENIRCNIIAGIEILKDYYETFKLGKLYNCTGRFYTGWEAALRAYNGWGCLNEDYVERVLTFVEALGGEILYEENIGFYSTKPIFIFDLGYDFNDYSYIKDLAISCFNTKDYTKCKEDTKFDWAITEEENLVKFDVKSKESLYGIDKINIRFVLVS